MSEIFPWQLELSSFSPALATSQRAPGTQEGFIEEESSEEAHTADVS